MLRYDSLAVFPSTVTAFGSAIDVLAKLATPYQSTLLLERVLGILVALVIDRDHFAWTYLPTERPAHIHNRARAAISRSVRRK